MTLQLLVPKVEEHIMGKVSEIGKMGRVKEVEKMRRVRGVEKMERMREVKMAIRETR